MQLLTASLVFGVVQGAVAALLGAGLVAVYRGTRVINFAHGAMAMVSTFVFVSLVDHGAPGVLGEPLAALLLAVLFGIALGVLVDVCVMRPLAGQSHLVRIIATLGVVSILQGLALVAFGGQTRSVPRAGRLFPVGGRTIGQLAVSWNDVGVVAVAMVLAALLTVFYRRTRFGIGIRAVSESRDAAALLGVRVRWMTSASWALGGASGAVAGILLAPSLSLNTYILTLLVVQGLAAALTGRLESLPLALAGGVGLGVVTSLATTYLEQVSAAHPLSWVNLSDQGIGDGVALLWILGLLLTWRRSAMPLESGGMLL